MNITPYTVKEGAAAVIERAIRGEGGYVCTVNATMAEEASRDPSLLCALREAAFCVPDGMGLCRALSYVYKRRVERCAGVDLGHQVCRAAADRSLTVGLWGAAPGVAAQAAEALQREFPSLCITFVRHGYGEKTPRDLSLSPPAILFVAQGSPRQELLMQRLYREFPHTVMLGLGGSLDVYAGRVKRAPLLWQRAGLEWLYRCLREPRRFRRLRPLSFCRLAVREKRAERKKVYL